MSFYTTTRYYRPRRPPTVTCGDLSRFIQAISRIGIVNEGGYLGANVRFGTAIDQDDRPSLKYVPISADGVVLGVDEIEWSFSESCESLSKLSEILAAKSGGPIYRAYLSLGDLVQSVRGALTREPCEKNSVGFHPDGLALEIGPISIFDYDANADVQCGWLSLNFSGPGYLYPWTRRDLLTKLESNLLVQNAAELCRATWPIAQSPVQSVFVEMRRRFKTLWNYEDPAKPWDWYWGVDGV